jgi:hypothetical protein
VSWSFKEQRRLLEIAASAKSLEEIVDRTGRTPKAGRNIALQLGISLKFNTGPGRPHRLAPKLKGK